MYTTPEGLRDLGRERLGGRAGDAQRETGVSQEPDA